jgi:pimeloyl-ACP methyl ester carboxylesterase
MTGVRGLRACLRYPAVQASDDRILLVMLPGAGIEAADFASQGLVAMAQRAIPALEVIAVWPELDLYLEGSVAPVLQEAVIAPALASGIRRIWLLGLSLGGMGALLHASAYPHVVEGLLLLAPFIGTHGTVAEIALAGSFDRWSAAGSGATPPERQLLVWLQRRFRSGANRPRLFLGHGADDRFAIGHRLLAAQLPASQVVMVDGGHDWAAWTAAWGAILALRPFA